MKNILQRQAIHNLIRSLEKYSTNEKNKKVKVGKFIQDGVEYGIKLDKNYFSADNTKLHYSISLDIEIPFTSGVQYIPIASFGSVHKSAYNDFVPIVRIDRNWITWHTSVLQNRNACDVSVTTETPAVSNRQIIEITDCDSTQEMYDSLESQIFQHNLICKDFMMIDEEYNLDCFKFAIEEFDVMYNSSIPNMITSIDLMPLYVLVSSNNPFYIPYDQISEVVQKYVDEHQYM